MSSQGITKVQAPFSLRASASAARALGLPSQDRPGPSAARLHGHTCRAPPATLSFRAGRPAPGPLPNPQGYPEPSLWVLPKAQPPGSVAQRVRTSTLDLRKPAEGQPADQPGLPPTPRRDGSGQAATLHPPRPLPSQGAGTLDLTLSPGHCRANTHRGPSWAATGAQSAGSASAGLTSQSGPEKPWGQWQRKPSTRSWQKPPWQGLLAHSSSSRSQCRPPKPRGHTHW